MISCDFTYDFEKQTLNIPSLSHLRQNILFKNDSNWSKQGCLRVILEFLSLIHMKPGHFCWGGKECRCNLMFWLRGGKRLHLVFTPFFPQPDLIKTPPFLPLYSLNFSKTRKLFQSIFLLFYLNQSFVYEICQSHLGVSASTERTQKRAASPSSCQAVTAAQAWAPTPGLPQCDTNLSVVGSVCSLSGRWNVDIHPCNYILTPQCPHKERQSPLIATFTSLSLKHRNSSWEAGNWNVCTSGADGLSFTHGSRKQLGLV